MAMAGVGGEKNARTPGLPDTTHHRQGGAQALLPPLCLLPHLPPRSSRESSREAWKGCGWMQKGCSSLLRSHPTSSHPALQNWRQSLRGWKLEAEASSLGVCPWYLCDLGKSTSSLDPWISLPRVRSTHAHSGRDHGDGKTFEAIRP